MLITKLGTAEAFNLLLQFSRERQVMDNSPEKLKKELEEELQLSSEDLRSHAWYHGRIPRQVRGLCIAKCALSFYRQAEFHWSAVRISDTWINLVGT